MRKSRFSQEQIMAVLNEQEAGMPTTEVCRKHGITPASFYKYKAKFGGMDVSDARKLRALEDENARLKKLVADLSPDIVSKTRPRHHAMSNDVNRRKW